jgi:hypothetical protein
METSIPEGGFKIERRKVRMPDGSAVGAECLAPRWSFGELMIERPFVREPALHRRVAYCAPEHDAILEVAGRGGLLTARPLRLFSGAPRSLAPEPVAVWKRLIRELRAACDLLDRIASGHPEGRKLLVKKITLNLAGEEFRVMPLDESAGSLALVHQPSTLRAAIWRRMAAEFAGSITCLRCAGPSCGRWILSSTSRSDKRFCSGACRNRALRLRKAARAAAVASPP